MKLAIKLPNDTQSIVQAFPFLHALNRLLVARWDNNEIDDFEIHLLCVKDSINVLNLLPFKAFYHELELEDTLNVFSMHRAIKNNIKLDYIDIYISTTKHFVDASIGKNLNAELRVGYGVGKNKLFFNRNIPYHQGQHQSDIFFSLLKGLDAPEDFVINRVGARDLESIVEDSIENPYIVMNLKPMNDQNEIDPQWEEFFDLFKDMNFYICSDKLDENIHDDVVSDWAKKINKQNNYRLINPREIIEFAKLVTYSKAFITYDSGLLYVSAYCGAHCFWLNESKAPATEFPEYFYSDVKRYGLNEAIFKSGEHQYNLSPVFDELYNSLVGQLDIS